MAKSESPVEISIADATSARLRGTAFGIFNLAGGAAMLLASVLSLK